MLIQSVDRHSQYDVFLVERCYPILAASISMLGKRWILGAWPGWILVFSPWLGPFWHIDIFPIFGWPYHNFCWLHSHVFFVYIYIYVNLYTYTYIIYSYVYIYMYVCMCIYIYTQYVYTHTHFFWAMLDHLLNPRCHVWFLHICDFNARPSRIAWMEDLQEDKSWPNMLLPEMFPLNQVMWILKSHSKSHFLKILLD